MDEDKHKYKINKVSGELKHSLIYSGKIYFPDHRKLQ